MYPINFIEHVLWNSSQHQYWIPRCAFDLISPSAGTKNLLGLLDTGAQHLFLPDSQAAFCGIANLSTWTQHEKVDTASGGTVLMPFTFIDVVIRNRPANVKVCFGPSQIILIGLDVILATMFFGVNDKGWLRA